MKPLIILLLSLLPLTARAIDIIGFCGVPEAYTSTERFRQMRTCGFTISLQNYSTAASALKALRCAEKADMRLIVGGPFVQNADADALRSLAKEPALWGWYAADEPQPDAMDTLRGRIQRLRSLDATHPVYVNLLPQYAGARPFTADGAYEAYLAEAATLPVPFLSFDFYPVTATGLRSEWWTCWEKVRAAALAAQLPTAAFCLSVPHQVYPSPTMAALRLQTFTNLAYGARTLQYFTYWTPSLAADAHYYHDAPIDVHGNATATYALVRQMNAEVGWVSALLDSATVLDVAHHGAVPAGGHALNLATHPLLQSLSLSPASASLLVSTMRHKDGGTLTMLVNKSLTQSATLTLRYRHPDVRRCITDAQSEKAQRRCTIPPGGMLLLSRK